MPADHLLRQAELAPDVAHLVLEQLAQRFDQLELHVRLEAAHVVVRLDRRRRAALGATDSMTSGYSVPCTRNSASFAGLAAASSNTSMNVCPMILRFARDPRRRPAPSRKRSSARTVMSLMPRCCPRCAPPARARAAQQAGVHEDAGELVADRLVHQRRRHLESTPPERPQITCASPTSSRIFATPAR
jgi:hypothetical protein